MAEIDFSRASAKDVANEASNRTARGDVEAGYKFFSDATKDRGSSFTKDVIASLPPEVLGPMSLEYAKEKNIPAKLSQDGYVSLDGILKAASNKNDPYKQFYSHLASQYQNLSDKNYNDSSWKYLSLALAPVPPLAIASHILDVPRTAANFLGFMETRPTADQFRQTADLQKESNNKRFEEKRDLGYLLQNDQLFNKIAGSNGEISKKEAQAFFMKVNGTGLETTKLQRELGPENWEKVKQVAAGLIKAFDNPANQDNMPGSVLVENTSDWYTGYGRIGQGDYMTRKSLMNGLGYDGPGHVQDNLEKDLQRFGKPISEVKTLQTFDNTKLNRGETAANVANRMLSGQEKIFGDAAGFKKAKTDLTAALQTVTDRKRPGTPQVDDDNFEKVSRELGARNPRLRDWFYSRYPQENLPQSNEKTNNRSDGDPRNRNDKNESDGKRKNDGGSERTERSRANENTELDKVKNAEGAMKVLLEGSEFQGNRRAEGALRRALSPEFAIWSRERRKNPDAQLLNEKSIERISRALSKTPDVKAWFDDHYRANRR